MGLTARRRRIERVELRNYAPPELRLNGSGDGLVYTPGLWPDGTDVVVTLYRTGTALEADPSGYLFVDATDRGETFQVREVGSRRGASDTVYSQSVQHPNSPPVISGVSGSADVFGSGGE